MPAPGEDMNCSTVIARYLAAVGIRHIFGYPGDPNVEFIEATRRAGLEFVLARREGSAAFMAEACGQLTGLPGVCLSTLGPGASSLVNGVANAYLDRAPMLAFSGQIESAREETFTHQVLDHNRLFAPVSKWTTRIRPDTVSTVLRKALRVAVAERPGPVHITTPADVVGATATDDAIVLPPLAPHAQLIQLFGVDGATDPGRALDGARRPVVIAGISAVRASAGPELTRFAETIGCPVVVAPMAKGIIAEDHPYFAGVLDMACSEFLWDFLRRADLILAVGFDAVELIKPWTPTAPVIHIDSTPNTDQIYAAETEIVGGIGEILDALGAAHGGEAKWSEKEVKAHRDRLTELYYEGRVANSLNPTDVVDVVREAMPATTVATTDVGSHKLLVGQGWNTPAPKGLLMTNGLSSMGYGLPAAIAARLMLPDRPVVCFTGDGGFSMVQGEMRLAASLKLGIVVVVFCDHSLNRIELKQTARQYPAAGTRIDPTDMVRLAESMGCAGIMVSSSKALESALANNRDDSTPLLIGAEIDPTQYAAQF